MFDLKKTKKHLLKCLEEAERISTLKKDDLYFTDYTYFKIKIPTGFNFQYNKKIKKHLLEALTEIRRYEPVKTNLPQEYIEEQVENILIHSFNQSKDQRSQVLNEELVKFRKTIKEKLKNEITEYTFTLHIDRLLLEDDVIIGNVNFYKLDEIKEDAIKATEIEKRYQLMQRLTGDIIKTSDIINFSPTFLKKGDTYAEVSAHGVQEYAYNLALYKIRLAINIIKLYIPSHDCVFGLDGETPNLRDRKYFLYYNDKGPVIRTELVGGIANYLLKKHSLKRMESKGLLELNKILQKDPKFSEYENRLLTGIYWFGEAVSIITSDKDKFGEGKRNNTIENFEFFYRGEKLLKLVTALESVLIFDKNEQITENIAERTAMIVADDYDNRIEIKRRIKQIYRDRSNIVHKGITYISKNDLSWLTNCTRAVLFRLIELKEETNFENKTQLRDYIEKLKLS